MKAHLNIDIFNLTCLHIPSGVHVPPFENHCYIEMKLHLKCWHMILGLSCSTVSVLVKLTTALFPKHSTNSTWIIFGNHKTRHPKKIHPSGLLNGGSVKSNTAHSQLKKIKKVFQCTGSKAGGRFKVSAARGRCSSSLCAPAGYSSLDYIWKPAGYLRIRECGRLCFDRCVIIYLFVCVLFA